MEFKLLFFCRPVSQLSEFPGLYVLERGISVDGDHVFTMVFKAEYSFLHLAFLFMNADVNEKP